MFAKRPSHACMKTRVSLAKTSMVSSRQKRNDDDDADDDADDDTDDDDADDTSLSIMLIQYKQNILEEKSIIHSHTHAHTQ